MMLGIILVALHLLSMCTACISSTCKLCWIYVALHNFVQPEVDVVGCCCDLFDTVYSHGRSEVYTGPVRGV